MIEHIVLIRWTEEASQEAKDSAMTELRNLKDKIPGIVELTSGVNFSERAKGYTHGLVFRFKDRAALDAYIPHPEHQRVVQKFLNPIRSDTLVFDYEV
ncbi:MAG TPA: Dabb family protein [Pseudomonadales bacterium]|nr:Dabb family protein [Pseudomonadales bacterium]